MVHDCRTSFAINNASVNYVSSMQDQITVDNTSNSSVDSVYFVALSTKYWYLVCDIIKSIQIVTNVLIMQL